MVTKLQQCFKKWNKFQVSLQGKVVITNHLVALGLWYIITLMACDLKKLHRLQKMYVTWLHMFGGKLISEHNIGYPSTLLCYPSI